MNKITAVQPRYGEIWAHDATANITSVAQNDWDQIVAFDMDGLSSANITPDHTNDHITISEAGDYQVHFEWSGYGPAVAHDWNFHLALNNRGTTENNVTAHLTTPTTQKTTSAGCTGLVTLAIGDTVELWVQRTSAGSNIVLTTVHSTISIHKLR